MSVKVSVILPFYNAESTIDRAIKSIAKQSFTHFECLLVDNNSTDKSTSIAKAWAISDQRFVYLHENRQGVVYASETGFLKSSGKYIARMDADDEALTDRLFLQNEFLDQHHDYGAVAGMVEYVPHVEQTDGFARYVNWVNSVENYSEILNQRFIESPIVNPSAMWRRSVAEEFGLYQDGDFPEDYEMWLRWLDAGVKVAKVKECVLRWFDSKTRLTRTNRIYRDAAFFSVKTQYLVTFLKQNNTHFPNVAIWGASRISRRFTTFLEQQGVVISFYIDIKTSRQLDRDVVFYSDIPSPECCFVLVYMRHQEIRTQIRDFLVSRSYTEGVNFIFVS